MFAPKYWRFFDKKTSIATGRPSGECDIGLYAVYAGDKGTAERSANREKENRGYGAVMIPSLSPVDYEIMEV